MKKIVILQPEFLPWVGFFEQINLADVFVHYDDVQYPQGTCRVNRVQIKTVNGIQWLTAPVRKTKMQNICECKFDETQNWRKTHLKTFEFALKKAEYFEDAKCLIDEIYSNETDNICDFDISAIEKVSNYFNLETEFIRSSEINDTELKSSEKLVHIVKQLGGDVYISGWGAKNYIDYDLFEKNNIRLEFMDYKLNNYPQLYGEFTPYVTIFDLIANCGKDGRKFINSGSKYWNEVV